MASQSLVDEKPIRSAVADLKGKGITRVSVSAPVVSDERLQIKLSGRLAHAALVLEQAGIPRGAITATAVDDAEFRGSDNIRIRFFGQ
jgi:hypothetical protein